MANAVIGPTLVGMEVILDSDTATMGLALSAQGGGFLAGAAIATILYDRYCTQISYHLN